MKSVLLLLLVCACESGPRDEAQTDASASVRSDAEAPLSEPRDDVETDGSIGGPCVLVDDAWGCEDPALECVRGWCQAPLPVEGIRCRDVPPVLPGT